MAKKLTIAIDAEVYDGQCTVVGRRHSSRFLNDLVRPHVIGAERRAGHAAMAGDETHAVEAESWIEGSAGDVANEPKRHG